VVGNSPVKNYSWAGRLRGLALYSSELTAAQVTGHYGVWANNKDSGSLTNENAIALYPFTERTGNVVHSKVASAPDLYIPKRYFVLHQVFLVAPWNEFHPSWGYAQDVLINIGGLIPLGFFFCAYFSTVRRMGRPVLAATIVGAMASLTIELTQSVLPTRDSGMTDLMTNTFGTALGAWLYRVKLAQVLLEKFESLVVSFFPDRSAPSA
jgi:VanZ family protein